jgi:hypothetical protein
MTTFTLNDDHNIVAYATPQAAAQAGDATATSFDSQAELARISAQWPLARFIEIFNSIPGNAPVKKFENRNKAIARVWKAIQPLAGNQSAVPAKPASAAKPPKASKPAKARQSANKAAQANEKPADDRTNKKAVVIAMMKRAKGATLAEIVEATGWQKHTVRGFVSILGSKGGETVESSKNTAGERTYKIAK